MGGMEGCGEEKGEGEDRGERRRAGVKKEKERVGGERSRSRSGRDGDRGVAGEAYLDCSSVESRGPKMQKELQCTSQGLTLRSG